MIKTARQLKDLIRNLSKGKSADAQILMRNYMMERFFWSAFLFRNTGTSSSGCDRSIAHVGTSHAPKAGSCPVRLDSRNSARRADQPVLSLAPLG